MYLLIYIYIYTQYIEDTKEKDDQEKRGKTLVFRNQRSQSRSRLQPKVSLYSFLMKNSYILIFVQDSKLGDDTVQLVRL